LRVRKAVGVSITTIFIITIMVIVTIIVIAGEVNFRVH